MPERQADDEKRAKAKAALRKTNIQKQHSPEIHNMDNGHRKKWKNGTGNRKKRSGSSGIQGVEFKEWNKRQGDWRETEEERAERRSRNSRENLVEGEKLRVEGIKTMKKEKNRKKKKRGEPICHAKDGPLGRRKAEVEEER